MYEGYRRDDWYWSGYEVFLSFHSYARHEICFRRAARVQDLAFALRKRAHDNATMKAILLDAERKTAYVSEIPVPTPAPHELRI